MALVDGRLLLHHEHLVGSCLELMAIAHTPSSSHGVFHDTPKAFHGVEVMVARGVLREATATVHWTLVPKYPTLLASTLPDTEGKFYGSESRCSDPF